MNGETEVPAEIFEEAAGKDVTVEFEMGGGVSWAVNGEDIPANADLTDLDLGVSIGHQRHPGEHVQRPSPGNTARCSSLWPTTGPSASP